jgi:hypothetical protein
MIILIFVQVICQSMSSLVQLGVVQINLILHQLPIL